ncbi:MAG: TolC family protein, partial [Thermotogota bacterium]|nr:TolC family protein [Thermotogota bacterium]
MVFTKKRINKSFVIFFILIGITITLFSSSLTSEYEKRLKESSVYQNLKLQVISAQQTMGAYSDIFDPYLSLNLQPNGLTYEKTVTDIGETNTSQTNLSLSTDLKLFHVFGTSIGLSLPVQYTSNSEGDSDVIMNSLGLNISRKLISEEQAEELGIRAQYLKTLHSLEQQQWALFISLVNDVFNQKYYEGLDAVNRKRMEIYSTQFENATDEDKKDVYKQQKLLSQKTLLNTEKMLEQITLFNPQLMDTIYGQIKNLIQDMYTKYLEFPVNQPSKQIQALELEIEKALAEKNLWFLPYLFNPTLSFNLDYYFDESEKLGFQAGDFKWTIGVSGSLDVLDRGEREIAALKREKTYDIKLLELKEEKERLEKQISKITLDTEISMVELELKELDYENKMNDAEKSLDLYKQGFITLEEKQLTLLELEQSRLDYI